MKTLADEALEALPGLLTDHPRGVSAAVLAATLSVSEPFARDTMKALHADGRAFMVRYAGSKQRLLVPLDGLPARHAACAWCQFVFLQNGNKPLCCSRACGASLGWSRKSAEERREMTAGMVAASLSSPIRLARQQSAKNLEVLTRAREKFQADPVARALLARKVQERNARPESRKAMSERRKRDWQDPEYREKLVSAHHAVIDDAYRQKRSENNKRQWAEHREQRLPKAREAIKAAAAAVRGTKQSEEHIRKRVESRLAKQGGRKIKPPTRSMKERWADPEWRAAVGVRITQAAAEHNRGRPCSAELRKKHSENMKRLWASGDHPLRKQSPETVAKRVAARKRTLAARAGGGQ